jgi:hypothetical protein
MSMKFFNKIVKSVTLGTGGRALDGTNITI